jgi:transcriptional regulator GlxA family with amidase domain
VIDDGDAGKRVEIAAARGRALAMTGAILEAAERAGYATAAAWAELPALAERLAECDAQHAMAGAVRDALRSLRRAAVQAAGTPRDFALLYRAVSEGLAEGVTLEAVAEAIGENPSALSKRLQRKLNMSFSEYKGRVRVDHAKALLRGTDLTVGEVARRVGIGDASNFSRLFEQHEGISPSKYRQKHRG